MRIYLVGFMGSGKTTFGRKLAQKLGYAFADLDERLAAHTGKTIPELFANLGEAGFRKLEQEVLHQTMADVDVVVSTGGGTPCFFDNMTWMNTHGKTVYMHLDAKALASRLEHAKSPRPLLAGKKGEDLLLFIEEKLVERQALYQQANMMVSGLDLTPEKLLVYLEAAQVR